MIDVAITDAHGEKLAFQDGAMPTLALPYPPDLEQKSEIWTQFLTDDGTATGTSSMLVAAGTVPFWVEAESDNDLYISSVSFVIADDGVKLNLFGAEAALASGCEFYYQKSNGETIYIATGLATNWDFVRMCGANPAFGTGGDAFKAKDVEGKVDAYIPIYDFRLHFDDGLRLAKGSGSKLVLNVLDQTDAIDSFNAKAYGKRVMR